METGKVAMSKCSVLEQCAFYNGSIRDMKEVGHFVKQIYCQQNSEKCVRLKDSGSRDVGDVDYDIAPWGIECKRKGIVY